MSGADIIDISELDDIGKTININNSDNENKPSSFGSGIELLMNDKKKMSKGGGMTSDIDIDDLNNLEDELNDLSTTPKKSMSDARSDMFSGSFKLNEDIGGEEVLSTPLESINLGASTKNQSDDDNKTWDGFGKFNNVPINPDLTHSSSA